MGYIGTDEVLEPFDVPLKMYPRQTTIFGSSGSGKTILGKVLIENAAIDGWPALVLDTQGDLTAMLFQNQNLSPVERKISDDFNAKCEVRVFGFGLGINVALNPMSVLENSQTVDNDIVDHVARTLVDILKVPVPKEMDAIGILTNCIQNMIFKNEKMTNMGQFGNSLPRLYDGPQDNVTRKLILDMSRRLGYLNNGLLKSIMCDGMGFGPHIWARNTITKKIPVSIIYLANITNEITKSFIVNMIVNNVYQWMKTNLDPKSGLVFVLDEISTYLPRDPKNPPSKAFLKRLSQEGRKFNLCCIFMGQNPGDTDYKSFTQAENWWIGQIKGAQNLEYFKLSLPDLNKPKILLTLPVGNFIYCSPQRRVQKNVRVRNTVRGHFAVKESDIKNEKIVVLEFKEPSYTKGDEPYLFCIKCLKVKVPISTPVCPRCSNTN